MYVVDIAKKLEEYNRLERISNNLKIALDTFKEVEEDKKNGKTSNGYAIGGIITGTIYLSDNPQRTINLNAETVDYIKYDLKALLSTASSDLWEERESLEVD